MTPENCYCLGWLRLVKFWLGENALKGDCIKSLDDKLEALEKMACFSRVSKCMGEKAPKLRAEIEPSVVHRTQSFEGQRNKMIRQQEWIVFGYLAYLEAASSVSAVAPLAE